jgi:hypothetical protein
MKFRRAHAVFLRLLIESLASNVKFAMAMPSAKRVARAAHQPQQGIWRVNTMDCGGETMRAPASSLTMSKK